MYEILLYKWELNALHFTPEQKATIADRALRAAQIEQKNNSNPPLPVIDKSEN